MCQHCFYSEGAKSYGENLPGYAQGAYLPGDEPGYKCRIDDGECYLEWHENEPDLCPIQEKQKGKCPDCGGIILKNGNNIVYCHKHCGFIEKSV